MRHRFAHNIRTVEVYTSNRLRPQLRQRGSRVPRMPLENKQPPLQGVKVVELGGLIAGPFAAGLLAQFGAVVI